MVSAPRDRLYTLILIGDRSSSVRKLQLSARRVRRMALLGGALAVTVTGLFTYYVWHQAAQLAASADATAIREENGRLRDQLRAFEERVARISATLDRVAQLDASLRGTTNKLDGSRPGSPAAAATTATGPAPLAGGVGGVGGPLSESPEVEARLGSLERAAASQESWLGSLNEYFEAQRSLLATTPNVWPARGWVTSDFGARLDPYTADRMMHRGLDIASRPGDPVAAPSDALVKFAGAEQGYGKVLVLDHGNGVTTRYGHLSAIYVKPGQRVKRGDRVAAVGNTGRSTGPHLHYEVRVNGVAENPRKFLME